MNSQLQQQARSVYRLLLRTQRYTFKQDHAVIQAAHQRTREQFEQLRTETDPEKIQKALAFGREVASILERNVAQATRMENKPNTYQLHLTNKHEINDNPPVIISDLAAKKRRERSECCGGGGGGTAHQK
ncbi:hypothetical protein BDF22DRAFT_733126 [Syncephalis plumigaleata]|nr:hypothetical protein BDF22DRAFT_733126 [Syncephalis plumigaleata]